MGFCDGHHVKKRNEVTDNYFLQHIMEVSIRVVIIEENSKIVYLSIVYSSPRQKFYKTLAKISN